MSTFKHHEFNEKQKSQSDIIVSSAEVFENFINICCPDSREKSLAKTNLEQAVMWANKAIAIHGSEEE